MTSAVGVSPTLICQSVLGTRYSVQHPESSRTLHHTRQDNNKHFEALVHITIYTRTGMMKGPSHRQTSCVTIVKKVAQLIDDLQDYKTTYFKSLLETKAQARPGVLELMDAALNDPTIAVGVCSAATKEAAMKTLDITLGSDRVQRLNVCLLGDDIPTKKPDPLIYITACQRLNMVPSQCIVIEDSLVGLRAAVSANMKCIITYTSSTANQDFYAEGAIAKVPDLGSRNVTLESIFGPLREGGNDADILVGIKDE